jgi:hypothetical protein
LAKARLPGLPSLKSEVVVPPSFHRLDFHLESQALSSWKAATRTEPPINETIDDANPLPLETTETGHLGFRGQVADPDMVDWYVITTDDYGDLHVQVTTSGDSIRDNDGALNLFGGVYLLDSNKTTSFSSLARGPGTEITHTAYNLRPGTYYIGLEKDSRSFYWGSYTVKASLVQYTRTSDSEPNDSLETANAITLGETVTGNLGSRGQDQGVDLNDYWVLNHTGNGDLAFSVRSSGSAETGDEGDGSLNLYGGVSVISAENPDSILYWNNQNPGTYQDYSLSDLPAGTYYIRLEKDGRSSYWGTYELILSQAGSGTGNPGLDLTDWADGYNLDGENALPGSDPNADGLDNLMSYALGIHPVDGLGGSPGSAAPHVEVTSPTGTLRGHLVLKIPSPMPANITYVVEESCDLDSDSWSELARGSSTGGWTGQTEVEEGLPSNGFQILKVASNETAISTPTCFLRVRIVAD